jgi:hypothetical protein
VLRIYMRCLPRPSLIPSNALELRHRTAIQDNFTSPKSDETHNVKHSRNNDEDIINAWFANHAKSCVQAKADSD